MRLPFLQVSQEEMARARTLAGYLSIPFTHALGMTVALKSSALEAAMDGDVSGTIRDPNPAEWMAVQCGWPLDRAEALAAALVRCGFAMAGPSGGYAVAGMEPYARALDTSEKRAEAGKRGAEARKSKGGYGRAMAGPQQAHGNDLARDAKTQTQMEDVEEKPAASQGSAVAAPAGGEELPDVTQHAEEVRPPLVLTQPGKPERKPREPSAAERLYAGLEDARRERCERERLDFIPEGWPPARVNKQLGPLAKATGAEAERLNDAFAEFLADPRGVEFDPPWSLGMFLVRRSQYESKAVRAAGGAP